MLTIYEKKLNEQSERTRHSKQNNYCTIHPRSITNIEVLFYHYHYQHLIGKFTLQLSGNYHGYSQYERYLISCQLTGFN